MRYAGVSISLCALLVLSLVAFAACDDGDREIILATTTSTENSGLLDELLPVFEEETGITVKPIAVGTGAALEMSATGDADVVLVHAPDAEQEYVDAGDLVEGDFVMYNDFVLVGPPDDPAGIGEAEGIGDAFSRIAETGPFTSRGDDSGTHVKERAVWKQAGIEPEGGWYLETGQGMGETLVAADRRSGYLLSVRGNFRRMRDRLALESFVEGPITGGDPSLDNPYGIIAVNPAIHDNVNYQLAMSYVGFLTSPEGQAIVGEYTVNGERLFLPDALSAEPDFRQYRGGGRDR